VPFTLQCAGWFLGRVEGIPQLYLLPTPQAQQADVERRQSSRSSTAAAALPWRAGTIVAAGQDGGDIVLQMHMSAKLNVHGAGGGAYLPADRRFSFGQPLSLDHPRVASDAASSSRPGVTQLQGALRLPAATFSGDLIKNVAPALKHWQLSGDARAGASLAATVLACSNIAITRRRRRPQERSEGAILHCCFVMVIYVLHVQREIISSREVGIQRDIRLQARLAAWRLVRTKSSLTTSGPPQVAARRTSGTTGRQTATRHPLTISRRGRLLPQLPEPPTPTRSCRTSL